MACCHLGCGLWAGEHVRRVSDGAHAAFAQILGDLWFVCIVAYNIGVGVWASFK